MNDVTIRVENLSKEYVIGARQNGYRTFREALVDSITGPLHRLRALGNRAPPEQRFWALNNVSFDVGAGEVVGVVGRNGAGKSTLLKILSRITAPTKGRVILRGRVASLLEVGTGFHPELTGRENIYLNGAILGMTRVEIRRKFDEIVAFAEIEKFLDTPVKHYSSGMYVRLAFAVAAHLEPDILLVDEVLAVGDADFQKKSLGKLKQISETGQTVLFVSHNLSAISALCQKGIYIQHGQLSKRAPSMRFLPRTAVAARCRTRSSAQFIRMPRQRWSAEAHVRTRWPRRSAASSCGFDDFRLARHDDERGLSSQGRAWRPYWVRLAWSASFSGHGVRAKGTNDITVALPAGNLAIGAYTLSIDLTNPNASYYDRADDCLSVNIEQSLQVRSAR